MADLQSRGAVTDIEGTLSRLRGVLSARVVANERGEIEEVHVFADQARHPKQVGRDVESALFSEHGVRIDHRKISVAQTRDGAQPPPVDARLKFLSIDYTVDRTSARARVSVGRGDDAFIGVASTKARGEVQQEELVARATLEAVAEFVRATSLTNGDLTMELQSFSRSEANGQPFLTVAVRVSGERGDLELLGSAIIRDDPWRAAASATLDAVNRRLPSLCA